MKKTLTMLTVFLISLFFASNLSAQDSLKVKNQNRMKNQQNKQGKHGFGFVDLNGDGYNDNAPDHDGDGIPNGLDEDYHGNKKRGFVDEDGDGINDNAFRGKGKGNNSNFGFGKNNMHGQKSGQMQSGSGHAKGPNGRASKGAGRK